MNAVVIIAAVLAVAGAVAVIASRIPVHSVLALIVTLIALAAMFISVGAEFMGILQVIVYAGAVMVMFVFVISLLTARNIPLERPTSLLPGQEKAGVVVAALVAIGLIAAALQHVYSPTVPVHSVYGTAHAFGTALFYEHVFALQLAALLLMVAVVGIVILIARRD